ncbi:hypothetical protein HDV05_003549 [Chytridiales sp. JEL 0842]|nr:hypothetical protein HDV05_003549 [Chytridiales sp. JEL 0842]
MLRLLLRPISARFLSSEAAKGAAASTSTLNAASSLKPQPKNEAIRASKVEVLGPGKLKRGILELAQALSLVNRSTHDLVMIDDTRSPPICRIVLKESRIKKNESARKNISAILASAQKQHEKLASLPKNREIPYSSFLVMGPGNARHGILSLDEAMKLVNSATQDLVLVSKSDEEQPVCRIMDKLSEQQSKHEDIKKTHKGAYRAHKLESAGGAESIAEKVDHSNVTKEIELKSSISTHDLEIKLRKVRELLTKGYKVQITAIDVKRPNAQNASTLIESIKNELADLASPVGPQSSVGKKISIVMKAKA